ncbi:MAG: hypothetical protein F6K23_03275 [Okeania sp. SIO2C9]|uniref:hypothetical protein n=1 Tax=Okeania sp. SIO2C9 TaxID=2607791 RepID=UPI0013BF81E4|nr:hypothetical protein [Okeania sp. SIO2C9]NEQ72181.1 hypothetical protein [Okeania sp. SIO2C9]
MSIFEFIFSKTSQYFQFDLKFKYWYNYIQEGRSGATPRRRQTQAVKGWRRFPAPYPIDQERECAPTEQEGKRKKWMGIVNDL